MADVNFRWAGRQSNGVDFTQGLQTTNGMIAERRDAYDGIKSEIAQLEAELAQIDEQIAQFDRDNPGIAAGDIDVAASLMEGGNSGMYQQIVGSAQAREQMVTGAAKGAMDAIWNGIENAQKLAYNLDNEMDETRDARIANIRVELDRAKRTAENAGVELPSAWYELDRKVSGRDDSNGGKWKNEQQVRNTFASKYSRGDLTDKDVQEALDFADKEIDKELSAKVRSIANEYKYKTKEAKLRYEREKESARLEAAAIEKETDRIKRLARYNNGSKSLKRFYVMDNDGILKLR